MIYFSKFNLNLLHWKNKLSIYSENLAKIKKEIKIIESKKNTKFKKYQQDMIEFINGKVEFKGTSWDAKSDDYILAGQKEEIIETRSILLIVKTIS